MTKRMIVNVSTDSWVSGQIRLGVELAKFGEMLKAWTHMLPFGCPQHRPRTPAEDDICRPYAFKAYAMKIAADEGATTIIWCDASVIPIRPLATLWEQIERDGYFIGRNGWDNSQWTADAAYADLFPGVPIDEARALNHKIPHVVGTVFGFDIRHPLGRSLLGEYFRLASETRAFCGPWQNTAAQVVPGRNEDRIAAPCGPSTTLGHRHDQTALSVIAYRLGMTLTDGPHVFSYALRDDGNRAIVDPARYANDTVFLAVGV